MNTLEKHKNLLLVAVSVIALASILIFLVNKAYSRLIEISAQTTAKSIELKDAENKLAALQKENKLITEVDAKSQFALKQLPADLEATVFVSSLEKLNTVPLTVAVNSTPASNPTKKGKGPESTTFNLTFNADFPTLLRFLQQMESLERFNSLSSITLSPADASLSVSMAGAIYTLKETK